MDSFSGAPRREPPDPSTAADAPAVVALAAELGEDPMFVSRTLRSFIIDGRLASIPARDRKKRVILQWLLEACFDEDRPYPEPEVNMILALRNNDVAALRRYLVDAGLLVRSEGIYRRPPARSPGLPAVSVSSPSPSGASPSCTPRRRPAR